MSDKPVASEAGIIERAIAVLKANDRGLYTIPAENLYPHQWLWDSCFIAIGQRHYDVERAKMEILSLLRAQWRNGMVPHIHLHARPKAGNAPRRLGQPGQPFLS